MNIASGAKISEASGSKSKKAAPSKVPVDNAINIETILSKNFFVKNKVTMPAKVVRLTKKAAKIEFVNADIRLLEIKEYKRVSIQKL